MHQAAARFARVAGTITAVALAAACGLLLVMWREHVTPVDLPPPTGPFAVGRTLRAYTNPVSAEELAVWMWYPAAASASDAPSAYLPPAWRAALREHQAVLMRTFFKRDPRVVRTHSTPNAGLEPRERAYPVVLLRAGGSALTTDFTSLAEDLASHGYIVVGFDAPYRSFVVVETDGRVIGRAAGNTVENASADLADPRVGKLLRMWTFDLKSIVDQLELWNADRSQMFGGRMDLRRVGAVGHSFGGATALEFCREDPRCRAAADLDGIPFGRVVEEGLQKPAMFVLSDHSREMSDPESRQVLSEIQAIYDRLPEQRLYATIRTANHFTFSDQSLLNSQTALALLRFTGFGVLDPGRGLAISRALVHTFFDVTLNGATPTALKHLSDLYPEVTIATSARQQSGFFPSTQPLSIHDR